MHGDRSVTRATRACIESVRMDFLYDIAMVVLGVVCFAVLIVSIDLLDRA